MDSALTILVGIVIVMLIVGLIKKTLWICIVSVAIGGFLYFTEPTLIKDVSSTVSSFFSGAVNPFQDNDYSDLIDDDVETTPNKTYENLGEDDGT
jgi:hypothetical protein